MKIYSDREYVPPGEAHLVMLYPWWGKNAEDPRDPTSGRYDRYAEIGRGFFEMTTLADADVAVLPMPWEAILANQQARMLADGFAEEARCAGKQVAVFLWDDSDAAVPVQNSVIFRTSLYRSTRAQNEFAMPTWSEDFVEKHLDSKLRVRQKRGKAVVGFCGKVPGYDRRPIIGRVKNAVRVAWGVLGMPVRRLSLGANVRVKAVEALSRGSRVKANFLIRDGFFGGAILPDGTEDYAVKNRVRQEYVTNMTESDYILCVRGGGNYSYRFYETLSCGRIPVFVDTDCVLPYDFAIDWKQYCVWVDQGDVESVAERVAEFHERLSPQDFMDLQRECRTVWQRWLSPEGFFVNWFRHFEAGRTGG